MKLISIFLFACLILNITAQTNNLNGTWVLSYLNFTSQNLSCYPTEVNIYQMNTSETYWFEFDYTNTTGCYEEYLDFDSEFFFDGNYYYSSQFPNLTLYESNTGYALMFPNNSIYISTENGNYTGSFAAMFTVKNSPNQSNSSNSTLNITGNYALSSFINPSYLTQYDCYPTNLQAQDTGYSYYSYGTYVSVFNFTWTWANTSACWNSNFTQQSYYVNVTYTSPNASHYNWSTTSDWEVSIYGQGQVDNQSIIVNLPNNQGQYYSISLVQTPQSPQGPNIVGTWGVTSFIYPSTYNNYTCYPFSLTILSAGEPSHSDGLYVYPYTFAFTYPSSSVCQNSGFNTSSSLAVNLEFDDHSTSNASFWYTNNYYLHGEYYSNNNTLEVVQSIDYSYSQYFMNPTS